MLWNAYRKRIKNTATALMSHATGNTDAVNACTITGKTENFLPVSSARKKNAPMTGQLLISYAHTKSDIETPSPYPSPARGEGNIWNPRCKGSRNSFD